jgi:TRAP-type uncharacterized transport system fused permease subunit
VLGVFAIAAGLGGWMLAEARLGERVLATTGGVLLFLATAVTDVVGLVLFAAAFLLHWARVRAGARAALPPGSVSPPPGAQS